MPMTTIGEALNIPAPVLDNIEKAQQDIDRLAKSTEDFVNKIGPQFQDLMHRMAQESARMGSSVSADFGMHIPAAIDKMLAKLREAAGEMGSFGSDFGKRFSDSLAVPSPSAGATAIDLGELAAIMSKLSSESTSTSSATDMLREQIERLVSPLGELTLSFRKLAEAQAVMSKSDVAKAIEDSTLPKIDALKNNLSGLLAMYARLSQAQIAPNLNFSDYDALKERIENVTKAINEFHKAQAEKLSIPSLEDVKARIEEHKGQLLGLKKDYADLFKIMRGNDVGSQAFQEAAVAAVSLGAEISKLEIKLKVLPMGMKEFKTSLERMGADRLREVYWALKEAVDGAEKGSKAFEMYSNKLTETKRAMVEYVMAQKGMTVDDLLAMLTNAKTTLTELRSVFMSLQSMLNKTTWSEDAFGRLYPDAKNLESAIGMCVVRMNEFNRAQQDVMAAASNVGRAAVETIERYGVSSRNSVELERLASDLKTAMSYLTEGSSAWDVYREELAKVEAQQSKLDQMMGRTEKSTRKVKEEVIYAADSLGYYQRELQRLNASATANAMGSSQWANDVKAISEYAANIEKMQRQTQLLTASTEAYQQKVSNLSSRGDFKSVLADLDEVKAKMLANGANVDHVDERIRILLRTYREWAAEAAKPVLTSGSLDSFKDSLKTMGLSEIEGVLRTLEKMKAELSRKPDGSLADEFTAIDERIKATASELERVKELMGDIKKYSWSGDRDKMYAEADALGTAGAPLKTLEELRALHTALRADMEKTATAATDESSVEVTAYRKVADAIKDIEKKLSGVSKTSAGSAPKVLDDIIAATDRAHSSISELKKDFHALIAKMRDDKVSVDWTLGSDWERATVAITNATIEMNAFRNATIAQNKEIQWALDRMAMYEREMKATGDAAMGRYNTRGLSDFEHSISDTSTTAARLKQDLSDLNAVLEKTAKFDAAGNVRNEWLDISNLISQAEEKLRSYNREKTKAAKPVVSPAEAMSAATTAKSYNELKEAIQKLKSAMNALDPAKDATDWNMLNNMLKNTQKSFDDLRRKMGELKDVERKTTNLKDAFSSLRGAVIAAFSVSAIKNWLQEMVEVHAQMRLQNVALRAILQNKDEADRIFMQVQQMAMQSPFSVMQLTTYTKQLAAYRVESEKLVGTTKMLADVSAGLGVGMDRLILAYGQVKSANYLRATEVRQFTEAGLNIAGELAKYFSEIKGQMVSVGEVMDMITKRMVKFEDVEEVFRRITAAGGLFYDMQKKQSETVHGQLQRIRDAYTIMLDDIGSGNSKSISLVLTGIREMMSSWRSIVPLVKGVAMYLGIIYTVRGLVGLVKWLNTAVASFVKLASSARTAATAMTELERAERAAQMTNMVGFIIALGTAIYSAVTATDALTDRLNQMRAESLTDAGDAVQKFRDQLAILDDTTASAQAVAEAYEDIKRSYGEIFTRQELEIENIRKLGENWESTEQRMKDYYNSQLALKMKAAIVEDKNTKVAKAIEQIVNSTALDTIEGYTKGLGRRLMLQVAKEIEEGSVEPQKAVFAFVDKLREAGLEVSDAQAGLLYSMQNNKPLIDSWLALFINPTEYIKTFGDGFNELNKAISDYKDNIEGLDDIPFDPARNIVETEWKKRTDALNEYKKSLEELRKKNNEVVNQGGNGLEIKDGKFVDPMAQKRLDDANKLLKEMSVSTQLTAQSMLEMSRSSVNIQEGLHAVKMESLETMQAWILTNRTFGGMRGVLTDWVAKQKEAEESIEESRKKITDVLDTVESVRGVDSALWDNVKLDSGRAVAITDLRAKYDSLKTKIAEASKVMEQDWLPAQLKAASIANILGNGLTLEEAAVQVEALADAIHGLSGSVGDDKKSRGQGQDPWLKRLDLMKKVNTEYEKLLKHYDEEETKRRITESFGDAVAEIYKGIGKYGDISQWLGYDKSKSADMLEDILKNQKIRPETRKRIQEEIGVLRAEVDIKVQEQSLENLERDVEEIFDRFDLTKTFNELGINNDLMGKLFGKDPVGTIDELKRAFEEMAATAKTQNLFGEDYEKWYRQQSDRIKKLELKQMQEQTKNYIKYTKEAMSARGKIMLDAMQEQNRIQQDQNLSKETKVLALQQNAQKMKEALAKQDWEDFKGSEMYVQMFENMEYATTESIRKMREQLDNLRDSWKNLPADQLKAMVKEIEKLDAELRSRNPFKAYKESLKEVTALRKAGHTRESLDADMADQTQRQAALQQEIADLETAKGAILGKVDLEKLEVEQYIKIVKLMEKGEKGIDAEIYAKKKSLTQTEKLIAGIQKMIDAYKNFGKSTEESLKFISELVDATKRAKASIMKMVEAAGGDEDSLGSAFADATLDLVQMGIQLALLSIQMKMLGIATKSAMGVIGYILIALEAVASIFSTIFSLGDKRKQKQIDNLKDRVDALARSYDRLKESIENAYKLDDYDSGTHQAARNIEARIKSYQEMIALEESKKKTDKSAVKEYKEAIEDLKKELRDLSNEQTKDLGGFGSDSRKDAAQSFVDTWLDAFKETGDGLDALGEQWDVYIENLLKKQAAYRIVGKRMEIFFNKIDAMANAHTEMSMKEVLDSINEMEGDVLARANRELKEFFNYFGWTGTGDLLLSDLQKGIQNITEAQAAALESITNSIRFGVWRQVDLLTDISKSVKSQYSSSDDGTLEELRGIRRETSEIRQMIDAVYVRRDPRTGYPCLRIG